MNKRYLVVSIFFFMASLLCLINLFTSDFQSYTITGSIVFTIVGIGFLRRSFIRHR